MTLLTYAQRKDCWEWCRKFIDNEAIYRTDKTHPEIPGKGGGTYIWQFYSRRATMNPEFAYRLGLLFWDHFLPIFKTQAFQICAVQPSGCPIGMAIIAMARKLGIDVNMFLARQTPKTIGPLQWFDGRVLPKMPVLMVDDAAASTEYMRVAAAKVEFFLHLPLHLNYFALINKVGMIPKAAQHTNNYLDNELVAFFMLNNFSLTADAFKETYGRPQKWTGIVR